MNDTWIQAAIDFFREFYTNIGEAIGDAQRHLITEDLPPFSMGWMIFWLCLTALLLFSGCWAVSVAKSRRYENGLAFFFLGFFVPVAAPLYLLINLPVFGDAEAKMRLARERAERVREQEQRNREEAEKLVQEHPEAVENLRWNKMVMTAMAKNSDGSYAGPWVVVFNDSELKVARILEAQDDFVQVELAESRDGKSVNIRLPYKKIQDWRDA